MPAKVRREEDDLRSQLYAQLEFLRSSAAAFDTGFVDEAKRLAVALRILLHDTPRSRGLLAQLDKVPPTFVTTSLPYEPSACNAWTGLLWFDLALPLNDRYVPMLDGAVTRQLPFGEWWTEIVIQDDRRQTMTRRDLVLTMCDQDGGAHVDPSLDEIYERLSRRNSLGWQVQDKDGRRPMRDPEKYSVRQIAHEVLRTLDEEYPLQVTQTRGPIFGGVTIHDVIPDSWQPLLWRKTTGRNDPCPCGSGKKFKKCHL